MQVIDQALDATLENAGITDRVIRAAAHDDVIHAAYSAAHRTDSVHETVIDHLSTRGVSEADAQRVASLLAEYFQ